MSRASELMDPKIPIMQPDRSPLPPALKKTLNNSLTGPLGLKETISSIYLVSFNEKYWLVTAARGRTLPDGSSREVTVGATGGGAGARVVEHGDEGVGRVADHGLQVKAVLREGRDRQRALPAGPGRQTWARKTRTYGIKNEERTLKM